MTGRHTHDPADGHGSADDILAGRTSLGIELGSTRIKACLIGSGHLPLAEGGHAWESRLVDGVWTYSLDDVWAGVQACVADLLDDAWARHGVRPETFGGIGVSAMMHGYLPFGADDAPLTPFRTWRNTSTGPAARELIERFGCNVPLRWSIAHLHQAVLDAEPHVRDVRFLTTLAGYVHWRLTGEKVLGVGDASGMFPIDQATRHYDAGLLADYDALAAGSALAAPIAELLPRVLPAGADAGRLTSEGAALLDPSGTIRPGVPLCPPEGDAGTGMVSTGAIAPRTGNVSAGTSIFAMVVLERPLREVHHEVDVVTTPAGELVAMVHCNNGASELGAWASLFGEFATAIGAPTGADEVFGALFRAALEGEADGGGLLAYNYVSGEPITGLDEGRPMVVRTPGSSLTLANFARTQLSSVFATLALGMRVLAAEGVEVDSLLAHGGMFRTAGVAQRLLAAAVDAPVAVRSTAAEGGAWGIALLSAYQRAHADAPMTLDDYLRDRVFAGSPADVLAPDDEDVAGFAAFLERYAAGLDAQRAAVRAI